MSLEQALADGKLLTLEVQVIRKDGKVEDLGEVARLEKNPETGEYEQVIEAIFQDASGSITIEETK